MVKDNLKRGRVGGVAQIRAEDIKQWLRGAELEEDPEQNGMEGKGDRWRLFVKLIQIIWRTGRVPRQMLWIIIVLIPKGGGDFRGIGLLEPFWKVIEMIMDTRLNVIEFHECLHGFVKKKGCGTAVLEAKLVQQLAYLRQTPLYTIFLDLRKAYDAMDRGRCIEILEGYGVGPNMLRLIIYFWESAEMVCRASGRYGPVFKAGRGVTQGGPLSPKIFNIMVDAIVREWLRTLKVEETDMPQLVKDTVIHLFLALFYADDAFIASTDKVLLQNAMDILVALFERVGLRTNVQKTQQETMLDGKIRIQLSDPVYNNMQNGFNTAAQFNRRAVKCDICQKDLKASSLQSHMETQHGRFFTRERVIDREWLEDREPERYPCWQGMDGIWHCPVPGCYGSNTKKWAVRWHFSTRHPQDLVNVEGDGFFSLCTLCGDQVSPLGFRRGHMQSNECKRVVERNATRRSAMIGAKALEDRFTAYGQELEQVDMFKYLGRLLAMDDNDMPAVQANLKKARGVWSRLSRLLRGETTNPRVCGMFYKAVVQSVLLYGSETWVVSGKALRVLEGFHIRSAYRMAREHVPRRDPQTSVWTYPESEAVLAECGLETISEYIQRRRQSIAAYIVNRPIFDLCVDQKRKRGSTPHQRWWEQPFDLELARTAAVDEAVGVVSDDEEIGEFEFDDV